MRSHLLVGLALLLLFACTSGPNPNQVLATVSTSASGARMPSEGGFAWLPRSGIVPDPRLKGQDLSVMLRRAITEELVARGLHPSSPGEAVLAIAYAGAVTAPLDDLVLDANYRLVGAGEGRRDARVYEQGSLIVDIIDARTQRGLWRGSVQGTLDFELDAKQRNARVRAAVQALLANLPPSR